MKNFLFPLLGPLLAFVGVVGLAGSSILWNFQGRPLGLSATILSLSILAVGIVLLRPLPQTAPRQTTEHVKENNSQVESTSSADDKPSNQELQENKSTEVALSKKDEKPIDMPTYDKPSLTTAEAIAAELAATQADNPEIVLINFAPEALLPGNSIRPNKRYPGRNLSKFRDMASDLFKSN